MNQEKINPLAGWKATLDSAEINLQESLQIFVQETNDRLPHLVEESFFRLSYLTGNFNLVEQYCTYGKLVSKDIHKRMKLEQIKYLLKEMFRPEDELYLHYGEGFGDGLEELAEEMSEFYSEEFQEFFLKACCSTERREAITTFCSKLFLNEASVMQEINLYYIRREKMQMALFGHTVQN